MVEAALWVIAGAQVLRCAVGIVSTVKEARDRGRLIAGQASLLAMQEEQRAFAHRAEKDMRMRTELLKRATQPPREPWQDENNDPTN